MEDKWKYRKRLVSAFDVFMKLLNNSVRQLNVIEHPLKFGNIFKPANLKKSLKNKPRSEKKLIMFFLNIHEKKYLF